MRGWFVIVLIILLFQYLTVSGQITRGAVESEIYVHCEWYFDEVEYYALFQSTNNGQTLTMNYSYSIPPLQSELILGSILGDAEHGVLYNKPWFDSDFLISNDHGMTWSLVNNGSGSGDYTSGSMPGELYHFGFSSDGIIERSIDYGNVFDSVISGVKYNLEVGASPGTVYGISWNPFALYPYSLIVSYDSCQTFPDTTLLDTIVAHYPVSGHHPELSRGARYGELYLVSFWNEPSRYKIFFSEDHGKNWSLRHASDSLSLTSIGINFTAGREDGSFYVMIGELDPTWTHSWLTIKYSNDTAKTFSTFFHDLTSTYGEIEHELIPFKSEFYIFPNRNEGVVKFRYSKSSLNNRVLEIRNLYGIIERLIRIPPGVNEINEHYLSFGKGVYIAVLRSNNELLGIKKFIIE